MPAVLVTSALNALGLVVALAQESEEIDDGLGGFTGWIADMIVELGEFGVGLFVFIETVFPPIPSEIILSLSGFLAERGRMNVFLVVIAATIGSVAGAWFLYALGAWLGEERAKSWLARIPLVEMSDLDKASRWFERHGQPVVFFGRFIPIVRSLVSLPAGAQHMHLVPFTVLTAIGSGIWNAVLIGAGYALGTQYERVEEYTQYLDYLVFAAVAISVAWFAIPRLWRKRKERGRAGAPPA